MWLKKKNAVPETRMHTTHSNILEPILDFLHTYFQFNDFQFNIIILYIPVLYLLSLSIKCIFKHMLPILDIYDSSLHLVVNSWRPKAIPYISYVALFDTFHSIFHLAYTCWFIDLLLSSPCYLFITFQKDFSSKRLMISTENCIFIALSSTD